MRRMSQPFRAVIFDLDGVLADSEPWWNKIDAQLLREYGEKNYHGEYHREVLGVNYRLAVEFYKKKFDISAPTEELMRRRGETFSEVHAALSLDHVEDPSPSFLAASRMKFEEALEHAEQSRGSRWVFDLAGWIHQVRFSPALAAVLARNA